jgi:predicted dehydrogenase
MANLTPLRWGILGCGSIANRWSNDIARLPDHRLQAAASRDAARAHAFARKFNSPTHYAGPDAYAALVADPDVDIIYVTTPHNFHKAHTLLALRAGKPVLCEKPFAINLKEAETMVAEARARSLFLMEGMWTLCFPAMSKLRALLAEGAIGQARMLTADFGYRAGTLGADHRLAGYNPAGRLFDPALAGGALMDVGVYPVSLAHAIFGAPDEVKAVGVFGHTGVDENAGMLLRFPNGAIALTSTSLQVTTPWTATLLGTQGRIEIESPWWRPKTLTLLREGQEPETFRFEHEGEGFQFEAMHAAECLRAGRTESPLLSGDWSLETMRILDALRADLGLRYPMDDA